MLHNSQGLQERDNNSTMGTKLILSDGIKENKRGCQGQKDKVEELKDSYIRQIMRLAMTKQWPKA